MTKTEKKVAELEKRVKELEARPQVLVLPVQAPVFYPQPQPWPWSPWATPTITCTSSQNTGFVPTWTAVIR